MYLCKGSITLIEHFMGKKKEKKEKKAGKRMNKKQLTKALLDFFHQKQSEVLSLKYIFEQLHLNTHPLKMLCVDILHELQEDDYINEGEKNKYKLNNHGVEMTGVFQRKSNGKNSFLPDGGGEPIFIAERNSAHAMAGDRVRIAFYAKRRGRSAEGEVIEILQRAKDTFVGTLEVADYYAFLVTENRTLANDIFIPKDKLKGGKSGDKAVVKVVEWPDKAKNPIGEVIDILGRAGENNTVELCFGSTTVCCETSDWRSESAIRVVLTAGDVECAVCYSTVFNCDGTCLLTNKTCYLCITCYCTFCNSNILKAQVTAIITGNNSKGALAYFANFNTRGSLIFFRNFYISAGESDVFNSKITVIASDKS